MLLRCEAREHMFMEIEALYLSMPVCRAQYLQDRGVWCTALHNHILRDVLALIAAIESIHNAPHSLRVHTQQLQPTCSELEPHVHRKT